MLSVDNPNGMMSSSLGLYVYLMGYGVYPLIYIFLCLIFRRMLDGNLILQMREGAGLSQADLARILGVTRGFICNIEHGRKPFPRALVEKLPEPLAKPLRAALIDQMMREVDRLASS